MLTTPTPRWCQIGLIHDFLEEKDLNLLDSYVSTNLLFEFQRDDELFWDRRVLRVFSSTTPVYIKEAVIKILSRIEGAITDYYHLQDKLYCDTIDFIRWPQGIEQVPHADSENPDGSVHNFFWRTYGCVLYLNRNFQGGVLYYPNKGVSLTARPGTLAFHPGTLEYLHGVSPITEGTRYTIASFWTHNPEKQMLYD